MKLKLDIDPGIVAMMAAVLTTALLAGVPARVARRVTSIRVVRRQPPRRGVASPCAPAALHSAGALSASLIGSVSPSLPARRGAPSRPPKTLPPQRAHASRPHPCPPARSIASMLRSDARHRASSTEGAC